MASSWIERRSTSSGVRFRVKFRVGGRESTPRYGGSFRTLRDARTRRQWVDGELAALRVPELTALVEPEPEPEPEPGPTLRETATRWQSSRQDIRESTAVQHRTSLSHVNRLLGDRPVSGIDWVEVQRMIDTLVRE